VKYASDAIASPLEDSDYPRVYNVRHDQESAGVSDCRRP
jgi:hypothetical protein